MYTEILTNFDLKKETPQCVIDLLHYLIQPNEQPKNLPEHPLFQTERWRLLFTGSSAYFDTEPYASLTSSDTHYHLKTCANFKNYDGEIDLFWDFITPYIDEIPGAYLGHKFYEENEAPTNVLFVSEGEIEFVKSERAPIWGEDDYWGN